MSESSYKPGVCNIGAAEIRRRRRSGIVGTVAALALWGALVAGGAAPAWQLLLFAPAFIAAIGFAQARARFCVAFGLASVFNFGDVGHRESVVDAQDRRRDRARVRALVAYSAAAAVLVTAIGYGAAAAIG
jgi:hypothetical protein